MPFVFGKTGNALLTDVEVPNLFFGIGAFMWEGSTSLPRVGKRLSDKLSTPHAT